MFVGDRSRSGWLQMSRASNILQVICIGAAVTFLMTLYGRYSFWHPRQVHFLRPLFSVIQKDYKLSADESGDCVQHFVMTKVERTGSSTLHSILARFIIRHQLNVMTPHKGGHMNLSSPNSFMIGPNDVSQADTLINHAVYNQTLVKKYVKPGYRYIGLVRHPVAWIKSASIYFTRGQRAKKRFYIHEANLTPEEILSDDSLLFQMRSSKSSWFHLGQLRWYGFNYEHRNNLTAIKDFIAALVPQMDIIIINDQYDASLVMLQRKFRWTPLDIFYNLTVTSPAPGTERDLPAELVDKLLSAKVNLGDKLLYDTMNRTWWRQPELKENNFWDEVFHFKELNKVVNRYCCQNSQQGKLVLPASQWHASIEVPQEICFYLRTAGGKGKTIATLSNYSANLPYFNQPEL